MFVLWPGVLLCLIFLSVRTLLLMIFHDVVRVCVCMRAYPFRCTISLHIWINKRLNFNSFGSHIGRFHSLNDNQSSEKKEQVYYRIDTFLHHPFTLSLSLSVSLSMRSSKCILKKDVKYSNNSTAMMRTKRCQLEKGLVRR